MHTYLLNNGGQYSDYGIIGIVQSDEPLDWLALKAELLDYFNLSEVPADTEQWHIWTWIEHALERLGHKPGIRVLEYEELSFSLRRTFDHEFNEVTGWKWED